MADVPAPLVWVKEHPFSEIPQSIETMPVVYATDKVRVAVDATGKRLAIRVEINTEGKNNEQ